MDYYSPVFGYEITLNNIIIIINLLLLLFFFFFWWSIKIQFLTEISSAFVTTIRICKIFSK